MSDVNKGHNVDYRGLQSGGIPFAERPTCSIQEACLAAGFGKSKMYELIDEGTIQTVKIGRRRLVRIPSLLALLATGHGAPAHH